MHEVLAVEPSIRSAAAREITEAHQKKWKADALQGLTRRYTPYSETDPDEPAATKLPQVKVTDVLSDVTEAMKRLFNVTLTKEAANQEAKADIVLEDGTVLLPNVPVTYLLFLGHQLEDLRTFVQNLPTLDPAETWRWDPDVGAYATPEYQTTKNKKVLKSFVKWAPPTPEYKQEAQVETFTEDERAGTWTARKFSGAIPADDQRAMRDRVDELMAAVNKARERANSLEVNNISGSVVLEYIFQQ